MNKARRKLSLLVRFIKKPIIIKKDSDSFKKRLAEQDNLPLYQPVANSLLLVRLDDIGDYILWRNSLHFYKTSPKWKHHHITLLGNEAWKDIFEYADMEAIDNVIWISKSEYLDDENYRVEVNKQLRNQGFETVICPARTRGLLLEDTCVLATGTTNTTGCKNSMLEKQLNTISDNIYQQLYTNMQCCHEFFFNQNFTNWCCGTNYQQQRPIIEPSLFCRKDKDYLLCYISASKQSRRLPAATWIKVIQLLKQQYKKKIIIAGGKGEEIVAKQIETATQETNITGQVSLTDMINYTAFADAVITGDTMQAHLAPSCGVPTVIVANGNTFERFSEYKSAGIPGVETVYAHPFLQSWKKKKHVLFSHYCAVTHDITTIRAEDILQALQQVKPDLLRKPIV